MHGRRLTLLVLLCAGQLATLAHAQEPEWNTITGPDNSFTAALPDAPKYNTSRLKAHGSRYSFTMHQYLVESGDRAFIVQSFLYPKDMPFADARATLKQGLENTSKKMEGRKWASVEWLEREGLPAVDATGLSDGQEIRSLLVIKDRQLLTLIYAGPSGTAHSGDAERFMTSLHIHR